MAFVVATGNGVVLENGIRVHPNAYASLADVDMILTNRGGQSLTDWNGLSDAEKEGAIIRATDFIDSFYYPFKGQKAQVVHASDPPEGFYQRLEFPRVNITDLNNVSLALQIPWDLVVATAKFADRAQYGPLVPDHPETESGAQSRGTGDVDSTTTVDQTIQTGALEEFEVIGAYREKYFAPGTRHNTSTYHSEFSRVASQTFREEPYPDAAYHLRHLVAHSPTQVAGSGPTQGRVIR